MEFSMVVVLALTTIGVLADSHVNPCKRHTGVAFEADPTDCSNYYWCLGNGMNYKLSCGPLTVWSNEIKNCVHKFSTDDTCSPPSQRQKAEVSLNHLIKTSFANIINEGRRSEHKQSLITQDNPLGFPAEIVRPQNRINQQLQSQTTNQMLQRQSLSTTTIEPIIGQPYCPPGSREKFAHPTECAQFYDCAAPVNEDVWGRHLRECQHPFIYDDHTKECVHFKHNVCGNRNVPVDPCDYLANQCRSAHCVPCRIRFASCKGMPDGLNSWRGRDNSPFFVFCKDQRVEFHGRCLWPQGPPLIFNAIERKCVPANV